MKNQDPPTQKPARPTLELIVSQHGLRRGNESNESDQATRAPGQDPRGKVVYGEDGQREDAYCTFLIESLHEHVTRPSVAKFFHEILSELDVRKVLGSRLSATNPRSSLVVQVIMPIALDAQEKASHFIHEGDAAYVATILHGVDYCFYPMLKGKYNAPDVFRSLVHPALQKLDREDPRSATVIRDCMRWGNPDEEGAFIDWLEMRMQTALNVLEWAQF
jgi:hypothetical protein